jgi:hypothetical protein
MIIRDYQESDATALRRCVVTLQAGDPGMIGKGYADLRDLPLGEPGSGSFGNFGSRSRFLPAI